MKKDIEISKNCNKLSQILDFFLINFNRIKTEAGKIYQNGKNILRSLNLASFLLNHGVPTLNDNYIMACIFAV